MSRVFSVWVGGDQLELTFYTGRRACAPLPPYACIGVCGLGCLLVSGVCSCATFQQAGNVVVLVQMVPAAGKCRVCVVQDAATNADVERAYSLLRPPRVRAEQEQAPRTSRPLSVACTSSGEPGEYTVRHILSLSGKS